jgi:septal ring-binding cell division protein DamX
MAKKAKAATKAKATKVAEVKVETPVVEAPVVETPVVEVKEEVVETPVVEVKEEVVEAPVVEVKEEKKAPAKKATTKKATTTEKKAPAKKAAAKAETVITLEFGDYTAVMSAVEAKVKAQIVADGVKESAIKSLNIYLKPFENKAYYVANEDVIGSVDMF